MRLSMFVMLMLVSSVLCTGPVFSSANGKRAIQSAISSTKRVNRVLKSRRPITSDEAKAIMHKSGIKADGESELNPQAIHSEVSVSSRVRGIRLPTRFNSVRSLTRPAPKIVVPTAGRSRLLLSSKPSGEQVVPKQLESSSSDSEIFVKSAEQIVKSQLEANSAIQSDGGYLYNKTELKRIKTEYPKDTSDGNDVQNEEKISPIKQVLRPVLVRPTINDIPNKRTVFSNVQEKKPINTDVGDTVKSLQATYNPDFHKYYLSPKPVLLEQEALPIAEEETPYISTHMNASLEVLGPSSINWNEPSESQEPYIYTEHSRESTEQPKIFRNERQRSSLLQPKGLSILRVPLRKFNLNELAQEPKHLEVTPEVTTYKPFKNHKLDSPVPNNININNNKIRVSKQAVYPPQKRHINDMHFLIPPYILEDPDVFGYDIRSAFEEFGKKLY